MPADLDLSECFLMIRFKLVGFGGHNIGRAASQAEYIQSCIKSTCPMSTNVRLELLVKVVSVRFLHCKGNFPQIC